MNNVGNESSKYSYDMHTLTVPYVNPTCIYHCQCTQLNHHKLQDPIHLAKVTQNYNDFIL